MISGVHSLITGLNGHGKTLYCVAEKLRPLVGSTVEHEGRQVPRRLVVGGIPELMLSHEVMDVPKLDPEQFRDEWGTVTRDPAQPPVRFVRRAVVNERSGDLSWFACDEDAPGAVPILRSILNWWAWVEPGDVLVIDEAQRVFRPMASGRRVPEYIAHLEIARHYGVQFVYLTQGPALLHTNLRNLIGPHEHVRRIFGGVRTVVYQWDVCTHPDRTKTATTRIWRHDRSAYGLYRSSQLHTSFRVRLPFAVWMLAAAVLMLGYLGWHFYTRSSVSASPSASSSAQSPVAAVSPAGGASAAGGAERHVSALNVSPPVAAREPYAGVGLHIGACEVDVDRAARWCVFSLSIGGEVKGVLSLSELLASGYGFRYLGPCSAVLIFGGLERQVLCDSPTRAREPVRDVGRDSSQVAGVDSRAPMVGVPQ